MPHLMHHPSPGFGDLLPGWHNVPGDPGMLPGSRPRVTRVAGIGELLPGSFPVPQNPVLDALKRGVMVNCPDGNGNGNGSLSGCGCGGDVGYINGQAVDLNGNPNGFGWLPWVIAGGAAWFLLRPRRS